MSIWASVGNDDIEIRESGYGQDLDPKGWIDVAHGWGNIRLMIECEDYEPGKASVAVTPDGARKLIGWLEAAIAACERDAQRDREYKERLQ
jgi:hypothetical protein